MEEEEEEEEEEEVEAGSEASCHHSCLLRAARSSATRYRPVSSSALKHYSVVLVAHRFRLTVLAAGLVSQFQSGLHLQASAEV